MHFKEQETEAHEAHAVWGDQVHRNTQIKGIPEPLFCLLLQAFQRQAPVGFI